MKYYHYLYCSTFHVNTLNSEFLEDWYLNIVYFIFFFQQNDCFEFAVEDIHHFSMYKKLENINSETFKALLESEYITEYVFPFKRMVFAWFPYKLSLQNVPHLFEQGFVMYSDVESKGQRENNYETNGLLSASSFLSVSRSLYALNIDVFGTDISTLDSHILAHLTHLKKEVRHGYVRLYLCSEEGLPVYEYLKSHFQCHGITLLKPSKQANRCNRLYNFEIDEKGQVALLDYLKQTIKKRYKI